MITAGFGLDPRGQPTNGMMPLIGGPFDGETRSIHVPPPDPYITMNVYGGRYVYADTRDWAYVWVQKEGPE